MNWSNSWEPIPKTFSQQLKEQNEAVDKMIYGSDVVHTKNVTLNISLDNGWTTKALKAIQVGDLAVVSFAENFDWLVVHVPTQTKFDGAIPDGDYEEDELINWCWKVQRRKDLFELINGYNNSNFKEIPKFILNDIQDYCLFVAVK